MESGLAVLASWDRLRALQCLLVAILGALLVLSFWVQSRRP